MERKTDHVSEASGLLVSYFQKPTIKAFVGALAGRVQNAETALWSVLDGVLLSGAVGAQLDRIAALLDEPRSGLADGPLRRLLLGKIRILRSKATANDMLAALRLIVRSGFTLAYAPAWPAGFSLVSVGYHADVEPLHPRIAELLSKGKAGGVRMWYQAQTGENQLLGVTYDSLVGTDPDDPLSPNGFSSIAPAYSGGVADTMEAL